jgi:cyclopropane-fatty-acyl-phospholipid synthase
MNSKLYIGEVTHTRFAPVEHRFRYPFYFYGFDLDELPTLDQTSNLFGYNRLQPVSLHDRDYLTPDEGTIRQKLDRLLQQHDINDEIVRVQLITAARYFNYIFNPVSFFYCYRSDNSLACIVTQVNNTFGDSHIYLLHQPITDSGNGKTAFHDDKVFHVSPFFPRVGSYDFEFSPAGKAIDITLKYSIEDKLKLVARLTGEAQTLNRRNLLINLLRHPLCAALTMPRILWQAARLHWQRRLPVYNRPSPSSPMTVRVAPPAIFERIGQKMVFGFFDRLPDSALTFILPDGSRHIAGVSDSNQNADIKVNDYHFFQRLMLAGDIGFGEAYMAGEWTTTDLTGLLTLLAENEAALDDKSLSTALIGRTINFIRHLQRPNTVRGSSRNIREHYDLSNEFFASFLDPSMTYSCGLFEQDDDTLEQIQLNKLRRVIAKAELTENDHVLEIGCGWGGFALEAVRQTGCRVTGITVSEEQLKLARQRIKEAGLEERIEIRLCDYRHIEGTFSKIVSIEMLEAVGHAGLKPFFETCDRVLEPGGRAVIQVITIDDKNYDSYRRSSDWIRKHIFPGGHLPSVAVMNEIIDKQTALQMNDLAPFGRHYARTLQLWRKIFLEKKDTIKALGFDDDFIRKWEYYFTYCEVGFNAGKIDLVQMILTQPNEQK